MAKRRRTDNTMAKRERRTDNTMAKRKRYKRANNDLQNITLKAKDRATPTPQKTGGEIKCCGRTRTRTRNFITVRTGLL
jgi:hypothetical protein